MMTAETEIVSYIPPQLYQRVEQFKQQQSLNSIAEAINLILEDYFGLDSCQTTTNKPLTIMVENLRGEVSDLKSQVSQLQQNFSDRLNQSSNTNSQSDLLNRKQLAERLGIDETAIVQHETDGKEFVEWSKSKDPEQISWKYAGANLFRRI
jgi:DNA-binding XRE family transcriptional regulator